MTSTEYRALIEWPMRESGLAFYCEDRNHCHAYGSSRDAVAVARHDSSCRHFKRNKALEAAARQAERIMDVCQFVDLNTAPIKWKIDYEALIRLKRGAHD